MLRGYRQPVDAQPVLDLIAVARSRATGPVLVGIGGRGGAGKTTLAGMILGAQIVSTDEFWDGEAFDIARLLTEVVEPLSAGEPATFAPYDWEAHKARGLRTVAAKGVIVIEGVCALQRTLRDAYAVRVWVEAPYEVRLERGLARDGEAARATWVGVWMPEEDRYVATDDPVPSAHVVIDGSGLL
jgi:uridine kinase